MVTKKCQLCFKAFKAKRWNQKYCCYECTTEGMRLSACEKRKKKRHPFASRQCTFCHEEYEPVSHFQKFCSDSCREKEAVRLANVKWLNEKELASRPRRDSNAEAYKFFRIKSWYPKNNVFRG